MGWFTDPNPLEEQIDVYNELLEEKQARYEEIKDVSTGNAGIEREQLQDDIAQIQINIEQTRFDLEQERIAKEQVEGQSLNDFED